MIDHDPPDSPPGRDFCRRCHGKTTPRFWPPRFRDLGGILGRILAAEIWEPRRDLGQILAAEIKGFRRDLALVQKSRRLKSYRESRRDLGENLVRESLLNFKLVSRCLLFFKMTSRQEYCSKLSCYCLKSYVPKVTA